MPSIPILCYAYAVLCCAILCYPVLFHAIPCYSMLFQYHPMPCHPMPCHPMPCHDTSNAVLLILPGSTSGDLHSLFVNRSNPDQRFFSQCRTHYASTLGWGQLLARAVPYSTTLQFRSAHHRTLATSEALKQSSTPAGPTRPDSEGLSKANAPSWGMYRASRTRSTSLQS